MAGVAFACYWPTLRGGYLWDDPAHVTPPDLRSWAGLGRIWTEFGATQQYYPVAHTAFWLEHRMWGDATLGYHLANVIEHVLAAVLFAGLLRRLWAEPKRACAHVGAVGAAGDGHAPDRVPAMAGWVAAALFLVHPVSVESVAWISEQKNTLSLVFYLLAAHAYLSFEETRRLRWYALATAAFLLALGTKTVTGSLPAALLVVRWWRSGRIEWRRDLVPLLPWFLLAAAMGVITVTVERAYVGAGGAEFLLAWWERLLLAARNIAFYAGKLLWPADLVFVYPRWNLAEELRWSGWLALMVVLTLVLWALRRRARGPLAAWLFFVGSLFPALGFVNVYPFRFSYVADHFQYLPSLGCFALCGWGGWLAWRWGSLVGRVAVGITGAVVVIALACVSRQQSQNYVNSETLYRSVLARNPDCWLAHNNLGLELAGEPNRLPEAIDHCRAAVRLKPDLPEPRLNLGLALARTGRLEDAVTNYREALRLRPVYPEAMYNLGITLRALGRLSEALALLENARALIPRDADTRIQLGVTLESVGRSAEALAQFEAAVQLAPRDLAARLNLAAALTRAAGRNDAAIVQYREALAIDPAQPETHCRLALLLEGQPGGEDLAAAEYETAIRLNPTYAAAHNNVGVLHARRGQLDEAEEHWQAALKADPGFVDARRNLEFLARQRGQGG
jgi:tetratricopeptide (TPR) repeat protein